MRHRLYFAPFSHSTSKTETDI